MSAQDAEKGQTIQEFVKTAVPHASTNLKVSWEGQAIYFAKHVETLISTLMAVTVPMSQSGDLQGIILAFSTKIPNDDESRPKNWFGGETFFWRNSDDTGPTSWLLSVMRLLKRSAQDLMASPSGMEASLQAQFLTDLKSYPPYTLHT